MLIHIYIYTRTYIHTVCFRLSQYPCCRQGLSSRCAPSSNSWGTSSIPRILLSRNAKVLLVGWTKAFISTVNLDGETNLKASTFGGEKSSTTAVLTCFFMPRFNCWHYTSLIFGSLARNGVLQTCSPLYVTCQRTGISGMQDFTKQLGCNLQKWITQLYVACTIHLPIGRLDRMSPAGKRPANRSLQLPGSWVSQGACSSVKMNKWKKMEKNCEVLMADVKEKHSTTLFLTSSFSKFHLPHLARIFFAQA